MNRLADVVVFDLDDTLYLERDYVRSGFRAVDAWLASRGILGFFGEAWANFENGLRGKAFDRAPGRSSRAASGRGFPSELARAGQGGDWPRWMGPANGKQWVRLPRPAVRATISVRQITFLRNQSRRIFFLAGID